MNPIEVMIVVVLLLMAVPDVSRWLGRPALAFPVFIVFGLLVRPLVDEEVVTMIQQAGQVGFLLLLFEVGLDIQLPSGRKLVGPLRSALLWSAAQYPLILCLAVLAGLSPELSVPAAAALTACSVGMAHPAWKGFAGLDEDARGRILEVMVLLEVAAIVTLALSKAVVNEGWSWWVGLRLVGMLVAVFLINRFAGHLRTLFQAIIQKTTRWRMHFLVLLVMVVCAIGERLGLSAPKTAFFLGIALSRARHDGLALEDLIAPVSQRFLIPVFFVGLGMMVRWEYLASWATLMAFGTAFLLLGAREVLHRRWFRLGGGHSQAYLLLCPNMTIVALAADLALREPAMRQGGVWLLLTGLILTVASVLLLPAGQSAADGVDAESNSPVEVRS